MMSLSVARRIQRAAQPQPPYADRAKVIRQVVLSGDVLCDELEPTYGSFTTRWLRVLADTPETSKHGAYPAGHVLTLTAGLSDKDVSPVEPEIPAYRELAYDYTNQAWIVNGVYQSCGHPKPCTCFGTVHAGEKPQAGADIH